MFELNAQNETTPGKRLAAVGYWPAMAAAAFAAGKHSRAVELCREGLAEEPRVVSGRVIYARALYQAGQVESATEQFYEVLARDPENLVALRYLGDIRFAEGDEYAAVAHYRRVLEVDPWCRELWCEIAGAVWRPNDDGDEDSRQMRTSAAHGTAQGEGGLQEAGDEKSHGEQQSGFSSPASAGPRNPTYSLSVKNPQQAVGYPLQEINKIEREAKAEGVSNEPGEVLKEAREVTKEAPMRTITLRREAEEAKPAMQRTRLREVPFYTETMGDLYLVQGHYRLAAEVYRVLWERGETPRLKEKLAQAEKKAGKE